MFQQTVYSFKAFYAAIQDYSNLASQYAMSCRTGQTCFLTFINGAFALLIPAALLIASGGDVRTALVNPVSYTHLDVYKRQAISATGYEVGEIRKEPWAKKGLFGR